MVPEDGAFLVWEREVETPGSAKSQGVSEASVSILDLSPRTVASQATCWGVHANDRRAQNTLEGPGQWPRPVRVTG